MADREAVDLPTSSGMTRSLFFRTLYAARAGQTVMIIIMQKARATQNFPSDIGMSLKTGGEQAGKKVDEPQDQPGGQAKGQAADKINQGADPEDQP